MNEQQSNQNLNTENQKSNQQLIKQISLLEPPIYKSSNLNELDKSKFDKLINIHCFKAKSKDLKLILKDIKSYLLKKPKLSSIIKLDDNNSYVYLNPDNYDELKEKDKFKNLINQFNLELEEKELKLNYDNYTLNEILNSILCEHQLSLSSFSLIGHIIHLNLKDEYDPFKKLIGQVLLDKNPSQNLVLNKTDKIDTTFRYFKFDILAKRSDNVNTIVQVNENGIKFKMDFAKVYWNPRLSTEHDRIIKLLNKDDLVYDVFAGIGPFAIPAAKKKQCLVFANDLNPESFKYLNENIKINKVNNLKSFNLDGREFISEIIKNNLIDNWLKIKFNLEDNQLINNSNNELNNKSINQNYHIIMNLPALAIEFLDEFIGLTVDHLNNEHIHNLYKNNKLIIPIVYCYCFHQIDLDQIEMIKKVKKILNYDYLNIDIQFVRKVAPAKEMYRLTFKLDKEILFADKSNKRIKI